VQASCEFSLLVSQKIHFDLSLTALDDALKQFYKKKSVFRDLEMLMSAKAKVNEMLAGESHQLREQKTHAMCAVMDVLVYRAQNVTTSNRRQF